MLLEVFKKLFRCPEWWRNIEKLRLNVSLGALRWSFWLRNASVETHGAHFGSFKSKVVIWPHFVTYFSCQNDHSEALGGTLGGPWRAIWGPKSMPEAPFLKIKTVITSKHQYTQHLLHFMSSKGRPFWHQRRPRLPKVNTAALKSARQDTTEHTSTKNKIIPA